jgi:hypothetical protein
MGYSFAQVVQLSLYDLFTQVVAILPDILGAIVVILIGLIVAPIFGGITKKIVDILKIDSAAEKVGLHDLLKPFFKKPSISFFLGKIVKWFFVIAFLMAAAEILQWDRITDFLNEIVFYIPNVLIAVVILVLGAIAGKFVDEVVVRSIKGSNAPINNPETIGHISKFAVVLFAVLAALIQLGIAPSLIQILFSGIVLAMALAFGLGGRDKAAKILDYLDGSKK